MSITLAQYFRDKSAPISHMANANLLLAAVNLFLKECSDLGHYDYEIDPDTNCQISGSKGGSGDGGYRAQDSKTGAPSSSHKAANAVDICDTLRKLAAYCVTPDGMNHMARHGLYMEDPRWTTVWCHFQRVAPRYGKRIYIPSTSAPLAPALPGQKPIPFTIK